MEKALAFLAALALLLSGCAAPQQGNGAAGGASMPPAPAQNGSLAVKLSDVVAGCGIPPEGSGQPGCGVHSSKPYVGNVTVTAMDITGLDLATAEPKEIMAKPLMLGIRATDSDGKISLELPEGSYLFSFVSERQGQMAGPVQIRGGQAAGIAVNFTYSLPGQRPS